MDFLTTKSTSLALFTIYKGLAKEVQDEFRALIIADKQAIEVANANSNSQTYYNIYFENWDTDLDTPRLLRPTIGLLQRCNMISVQAFNRLSSSKLFFLEIILQKYNKYGHLRFISGCGKKIEEEILTSINAYFTLIEHPQKILQDALLTEEMKNLLVTPYLRPARNQCFINIQDTPLTPKAIQEAEYKGINTVNDLIDYYEMYRTFSIHMNYNAVKGITDQELLDYCFTYLTEPSNSATS